eukprot:TRINITY_DN16963_c0_g1_i1.p1 TRINITY_DN16963_c0_g1~~TRINITY_DN16963_c0_g1_i1.p1  ORF type:complete len:439 (+),score=142.89 TRINITY_DN16963_c0_g1_i1:58-1374(+)
MSQVPPAGMRAISPECSAQTHSLEKGYDPHRSEGAAVTPVFRTSTFLFKTCEEGKRAFEIAYGLRTPNPGESPALIYSRVNNPNSEIVEDRLTTWDHAQEALLFSSGMGSISSSVLTFVAPGDSVIFSDPVYGGTEFFMRKMLPKFGIKTYAMPAGCGIEEMRALVKKHDLAKSLKIVYCESPANPTIMICDLPAARQLCDEIKQEAGHDVLLFVDNTFLGPIFTSPLQFGADVVIYSATKFLGGHSDVVAGAALGSHALIGQIKGYRCILGSNSDPDTAWLIQRSLPTLQLRMERQQSNALRLFDYLLSQQSEQGLVERIAYPGAPDMGARQIELFKKLCTGSGSLITFIIKGSEREAFTFLNALHHFSLAVSLGGVESLIEHPYTMTHSDMTTEEKLHAGITEGMIRISVGLEDPEDLIRDLQKGFAAVRALPKQQ